MQFAATLMVDASWCPEYRVGGYGYWIASPKGKWGNQETLRGIVETSTLAEMQAVVNVLYIARKSEYVLPGDSVLIQTDCKAAIMGLEGGRKLSKAEAQCRNEFKKLMQSIYVELRHVKGHTMRAGARFEANRRCDAGARDALNEARKMAAKGLMR